MLLVLPAQSISVRSYCSSTKARLFQTRATWAGICWDSNGTYVRRMTIISLRNHCTNIYLKLYGTNPLQNATREKTKESAVEQDTNPRTSLKMSSRNVRVLNCCMHTHQYFGKRGLSMPPPMLLERRTTTDGVLECAR